MKISLKYLEDKLYEATNETGNSIKIDMKDPDEKQYQSPMQLLLSATVACAAVDIVSMIKKKRKTFVDLEAEISGFRREDHPRKFTTINIKYTLTSPDTSQEELHKVVSLAVEKYCSVAVSLDGAINLTHDAAVKTA
ncbi:MAG: OsmC family protein [Cyclobacteriaceae bacterium]